MFDEDKKRAESGMSKTVAPGYKGSNPKTADLSGGIQLNNMNTNQKPPSSSGGLSKTTKLGSANLPDDVMAREKAAMERKKAREDSIKKAELEEQLEAQEEQMRINKREQATANLKRNAAQKASPSPTKKKGAGGFEDDDDP